MCFLPPAPFRLTHARMLRCIVILFLIVPISAQAEVGSFGKSLAEVLDDGRWDEARRIAKELNIEELHDYIAWREAVDDDYSAPFETHAYVLNRLNDWPLKSRVQTRAEAALLKGDYARETILQWFKAHPPISARGKIALASALPRGDSQVKTLVREAWGDGALSAQEQEETLKVYEKVLNQNLHQKRIEYLLWNDRASQAEDLLSFVDKDAQALYRARIALIRKDKGVDGKVAAVPAKLRSDEGLRYDRMRWRHKKKNASGALEILTSQPVSREHAEKWWKLRHYYAREMIEVRNYKKAAQILSAHGEMPPGPLAQALWLLGWVQLEYLDSPKPAYENFYKMFHTVKTPVSKARAAYWAARAAGENNNASIAEGWYRQAAKHPTVFYGQLAFEALHPRGKPSFPRAPSISSSARKTFQRSQLVQVMLMLNKLGMEDAALPFQSHLAQQATTPEDFALIAELAEEMHWLHGRVKAAKWAIRDHHLLVKTGWPTVKLPSNVAIEPALSHAIARQESEFKPDAVSRANARGLMQLLPSTARKVAKERDMSYSKVKLFNPEYNLTLGSHYLGGLIDGFDGNYILAIAGYNAGPGRSRQWVERFGYPGKSLHQTINWMETIPFKETRNYVQRVLENVQVYRQLIDGSEHKRLSDDLVR